MNVIKGGFEGQGTATSDEFDNRHLRERLLNLAASQGTTEERAIILAEQYFKYVTTGKSE